MSEQFKMTFEEWQEVTMPGGHYRRDILKRSSFPWDQIIAYRHCKDGEDWVDAIGNRRGPKRGDDDPTIYSKVFILRPRKKVTVTDYVFKATGKPHVSAQWYRNHAGEMAIGWESLDRYEGYTREEITREIEVDE